MNLHKTYRKNAIKTEVLKGLDLEVAEGEFLCIIGASGSGKSTLLHLLGTLDRPNEGTIELDGERIDNLLGGASAIACAIRRLDSSFSSIICCPELTALENVLMPQMIAHSVFGWMRHAIQLARKRRGAARPRQSRPSAAP